MKKLKLALLTIALASGSLAMAQDKAAMVKQFVDLQRPGIESLARGLDLTGTGKAVMTVFGLAGVFGAAPFLPRRPWVWIYDLVLICLGLTSVCCLPATIPLLVYWLKPEAKSWFGRV